MKGSFKSRATGFDSVYYDTKYRTGNAIGNQKSRDIFETVYNPFDVQEHSDFRMTQQAGVRSSGFFQSQGALVKVSSLGRKSSIPNKNSLKQTVTEGSKEITKNQV